jgi:hypothetical protein
MRALFTLFKRQLADNAIYFLAAIIFSIVLVIAILSITFSEDITYLSLYTVILIVITPILFGIGSYILGVIQTYSDKTNGITAVLTILPVTRGRIFLSRLIIGILIILTLLGPLVVTGAILWKLLGPPDWLYYDWLADTFIGLSLASLVCYCLGLTASRGAETFTSALRALPLVPILMLLIVIKGFGWSLLAVLLPLLAILLLRCFKSDSNHLMTTLATGFTVLVLLDIPLYFGRYLCDGSLANKMDASATVSPSGLLLSKIENDPNVEDHSEASSSIDFGYHYRGIVHNLLGRSCYYELRNYFKASPYVLENLGITEYFGSRKRGKRIAYKDYLHRFQSPINIIHLDEVRGLLVYHRTAVERWYDEFTWQWKALAEIYAGPEGVSADPNSNLGYFKSPFIYLYSSVVSPKSAYRCLVFDRNSKCFFDINFENQTVRKGPQLQDLSIHPIKTGSSANLLRVWFRLPSGYKLRLPFTDYSSVSHLPIVYESGQINLLDPNTLELHGPAGYLPRPKTLFGRSSPRPRDLLDYDVEVMAITPNRYPIPSQTKGEYLGLVAGSLSRQGMWTSVAVFDKDGKKIKSADSKSTFFDVPGGPILMITKYIFESLHPPVLTLASFFTAYSFDARSTHQALFLMPNSFVAMARDYEGNIFYKFLLVLLLMLPGILFAALLGWRVVRNAEIIGLSRKAMRFWLAGTLVFGLPAYITYRLTRPKVTLVTCANCGNLRRPDTDICHRCGGKWDVPELIPPAWRVLDKPG